MAILVITLLLLSTAFLHEAIDSVGTVPDLDLLSTIGEVKRPSTGSKGDPSANINGGFSQECEVEGFFNETEGEALMSVGGPTGTSYLRATVFENYRSGVWTPHTSVKKPYPGEIMPSEVSIYEEEIDMNIIIKPIVNMSGYIPVVLNLQRVTSEVHLEYVRDLKIFYSETPFTSQYIVSYSVYTYGEEMLESARIVYEPSYLEIPKGIADLLRQIAEEAVGNATTPYGKIMNIIAYLKENYRYNLKYPQAPTSVDPIEWFLTGSKEGVCTHFNSALVLLTRSLGIRARLAGGYLIQPELEAQLVYADQRHAFSEISFEGLGWVIFDATPSTGCSECESIGGKEEKPGEEGEADTCSPTDSVYNQSDCKDCVNNGTRLSPEGGTTPDIDLFEIRGITGSSYLRTIVGEHYDGLWDMIQPIPQHYGGWMISNQVSGYIRAPIYTYTISPLRKMGGFIPTARYTNRLWFDATVDYYPEQLIFFSSEVSEAPYSLSNTRYEFDHGVLNGAIPNLDSRYMNVPTDLLYELRRLASDATSSAETPYDKLNALESFLQSNYEYDVNYTRAPEGFDPVEWFLFHEKRGVCANFNSAFVLLARSIGLPARLVAGYTIDPSAEEQMVNAKQAHMYSEALFEDIGWITFDATAPGGESEAAEEGGKEEVEPVEEVFNQTKCEDCVNNCTKMDPEGGMPPEVDLFQIYGITGTAYLRTMVGEAYDGTWGMIEPSQETYDGEVIGHQVSGYIKAQTRRFMVSPLAEMGGFISSTLSVSELDIDWPLQRYPDQQIFFSNRRFNTSYIVSHVQYDFDQDTFRGASLIEDAKYLGVPTELLPKFRSLALEATLGAETPYDKLNALESFLRSNYEYDVNYTRAPEGFDPVEWFLFHEKRGVCANFNSAFVLLARSIGLPARYIGGYLIDPSAEIQTVTSMQAHGYSEVPFEELGWVTFDATGPGPIQEEDVEEATIIGTSTEITWLDAIGVRGSTFNVVGRVLDEDGEAVDGLRTLVYLKEDKSEEGLLCGEGLVVDGLFNVTCSLPLNITIGYYQIDAHTLGNNRYNGSWSDPPLKVVSRTDFVLEAPEKVIAGKPFIFQGNLTEHGTGDPVSDTICTAEIRLEEIQLETDRNGYFEGTYTLTEPGNYTLSLEWPGSEYHLGSAAYSSVRIVPLTVTPGENEMMVRLEEAQIVGTVHAEELPGLGEEVVISIDGQDIGTAIADGDGGFTFTYEVPRTQELGEAQIGYRLVSASYSTTQQSAVYARTKVVLDAPSSIRVNRQFAVGVSLKDDLGGPMAEAELTLVEEGSEEEAIGETDSEGALEVALKIEKMPEAGFVSYAVRYGGEDYYLESSSEVTLDVLPPIGLPEMDVIKTVTNVLIFSVLVLIGYTVYVIAKRRLGKGEEDELGEAQLAPDEPEPAGLKQVVGILRQDDRFHFEFPQFSDPFPLVWGKGEELVFRMGLVAGRETFGGSVGVLLMVDEAEGPSFDLSTSSSVDHSLTFHEKGYHSIKVVFSAEGARVTACEALVKIVDYREEVNDLFNEEFEGYRNLREEIETHFTAREFMRSMLKGLSNRFYAPLNEMVSIFEIADYSLHDVRRSDYERFYAARQEFEEMKVGN